MRKLDEINDPESTLNKAAPDEWLFILRGQDLTAPETILEWIKMNLKTGNPAKLREAFEAVMKMSDTPIRKMPD